MPTTAESQPNVPIDEVMAPDTRHEFEAEIGRLRASNNSGPSDRRVGAAGIVVALFGFAVILVAYNQTRSATDVRDQMESLVLAVLGASAVVFGSVLYLRNSLTRFLRFWLLRMVYEQRDLAAARDHR